MISVVVATYNRAHMLREHIDSVLAQEGIDFECVYVDDGSTDETPHVLESYAATHSDQIRWLRVTNRGQGLARNVGVDHAKGELLVFTDDDVVVPPGWLAALHESFMGHSCGAVSGGFAPYSMQTPVERYLHHRMKILFGNRPRSVRAAPMMSFMVSKATFLEVGGFTEEPIEDWVLCRALRKKGYRIHYDPTIQVVHRYQSDWAPMARRMRMHAVLGMYDRLGRRSEAMAYLGLAAWKYLSAPIWSLWRYPKDLYLLSLKVEHLFFMARLRAFSLALVGKRIGPPDWV